MRKLIVGVQFVVDVEDEVIDRDQSWDAAIEYCREMFTAVNYPNRMGDEWYIEEVTVDDGSDDEPDITVPVLHLTPVDTAFLMAQLDGPPSEPTEAMLRAAQRRRELFGE